MNIKITCAILCYNYGKYLDRAIESCLQQTLDKSLYDVLVIDDGSTDNTAEVCAFYGDSISVSRSENLGFTKSIERALTEAKGDYVAFLDADDWWELCKLEKVYSNLKEGIYAVAHPMNEVDGDGKLLDRVGACGNTSSICVHRKASLTLMPSTSEIFAQAFLKLGKGVILDNVLANYRIHAQSMTDRSANTKHTEFFANTNKVLSDNLFKLVNTPPFWELDSNKVLQLATYFKTEAIIKGFERATELKTANWQQWLGMIKALKASKTKIGKRELRYTVRLLIQPFK